MRYCSFIDNQISEREYVPQFEQSYDVVVAGLGTAGAMAAITAAQLGLSVWGFDRLTGMGGIGTLGCVYEYYFGQPGGRLEQVNTYCDQLMETQHYVTSRTDEVIRENRKSYSGMVKSYALEVLALQSGAVIDYGVWPMGIYLEEKQVAGIRCLTPKGILDVETRVIIDATGEADIAHLAGCPMQRSRRSDQANQLFAKLRTVLVENRYIKGEGKHHGRVDCTNARDLSKAVLKVLREPVDFHETPEKRTVFESPILGTRSGRRIKAREILTLRDYLYGKVTKEPVFYAAAHLDNTNHDVALEEELFQDFQSICGLKPIRITVPIPMQALVAEEIEGILAAGKCIGVDYDFSGCVRMKLDMEKTGEAAATIAYVSIKDHVAVSKVDYEKVAFILRSTGCLDDTQNQPWQAGSQQERIVLNWPESPDEMLKMFKEDIQARVAMWSARMNPDRWRDTLLSGLYSGHARVAQCSALALGMIREEGALVMLRELSEDRVQLDMACKAICLLGRYGKAEDAERLLCILRRPLPVPEENDGSEDIRVLVFLEAQMALLKIIRHNTSCRKCLNELLDIVFAPDFIVWTRRGTMDITDTVRKLASDG